MGPLDEREPETVRVAVLLAGGEARRLGADKRRLRIGGTPLLERNLDLLRDLFPRVAVSLRAGQDLGGFGDRSTSIATAAASERGVDAPRGDGAAPRPAPEILTDAWSGSPLAAIATALDHFGEPVFVLACDLALADRDAISTVLDGFRGVDLALPIVGDKLEPLHAVYGPACLAPMRRLLERDRHRILDIAPDIRVATVPFPTARPFFNINHPEDYEAALRTEVERLVSVDDAVARVAGVAGRGDSPAQPPLVAIVGKSDSGKTTFIEKLLPELAALGLRVGTVKHDVHGFEVDTEGKDSWRHARAGAVATMVAGPGAVAFMERSGAPQPLAALARRFFDRVDLVVAEGFKREATHRIEVFRRAAGHGTPLCGPGESLALVTDADVDHPRRFSLDDAAGVARLIAARLDELRRY